MPPRPADPTLAPAALKAHARAARAAQLAAQADRDARELADRLERLRRLTVSAALEALRITLPPEAVTIVIGGDGSERITFEVDGIPFSCVREFGEYRLFIGQSCYSVRSLEDLGAYLETTEQYR